MLSISTILLIAWYSIIGTVVATIVFIIPFFVSVSIIEYFLNSLKSDEEN